MNDYGVADSLMSVFGFKRVRCEDCKQSIPTSMGYPKMLCRLREEFVDRDNQCSQWEKKQ